jgi:hypothetical protein
MKNLHCLKTTGLGQKVALAGTVLAAGASSAFADAATVTAAISDVATDAGTGVTAGVTIGAVVFGARVVWGAIKSMAS